MHPLTWIRKAIRGEANQFEWRGKTLAGRELWLEITLQYTTIVGEERLLAVVRDIAAQKEAEGDRVRLEQQLLHSQKLEAIGQQAELAFARADQAGRNDEIVDDGEAFVERDHALGTDQRAGFAGVLVEHVESRPALDGERLEDVPEPVAILAEQAG